MIWTTQCNNKIVLYVDETRNVKENGCHPDFFYIHKNIKSLLPISLEIRSYPEENFHDFGTKPSEITEYRNRYQESYGGCTFFAACRNLSHHQGKG